MLELKGKCDLRAITLSLSNILSDNKKVAILTDDSAFRRVAEAVDGSDRVLKSDSIYIIIIPELINVHDLAYLDKLINAAMTELTEVTGETFEDKILAWSGSKNVHLNEDVDSVEIEMYKTGIERSDEYSWEVSDNTSDENCFMIFSDKKLYQKTDTRGAKKVLIEKEDICSIYKDEELGRFKYRNNNWSWIAKQLAQKYFGISDRLLKKW